MPPTPEEAAKDLEEGQLDFYRELYNEGDMAGAQEFFDSIQREKAEDAARQPVPKPPAIKTQRQMPGMDPTTTTETPDVGALQDERDRIAASSLVIPGLLDDAQQEVYAASVKRYKAEGFPDEEELAELFRTQYENTVATPPTTSPARSLTEKKPVRLLPMAEPTNRPPPKPSATFIMPPPLCNCLFICPR